MDRDTDRLIEMLFDVRTVFDPDSAVVASLRNVLDDVGDGSAVAWVALTDSQEGLVIEHVLGERTRELDGLEISAGQGLTGLVYQRPQLRWVDHYIRAPSITHEFDAIIEAESIRRLIAAPLCVEQEMLGVLSVGRRDGGPFSDKTIADVEGLAQRASMALAVAKRTRDSAAAAAAAERRRLSEELHDGVGALLFALASRAERLERRVTGTDRDLSQEIGTMQREICQVSSLVRGLVAEWHSSATSDLQGEVQGIVEDFERRSGIKALAVFMGSTPVLLPAAMRAITRFVAEALTNVERHAQASHATVTVATVPGTLAVAVSNDGPSPSRIVPGIGLLGAEERITRLGGTFTAVADDPEGLTVRACVPLP